MPDKVNVALTLPMDATELWSSICGAAWETWSWWRGWDYVGGDWDEPCTIEIICDHPDIESDDPETWVQAEVTLADIVRAIGELGEAGYGNVVADVVNDNLDACSSDVIMQQAVYGTVIYG